VKKPRVEKTVVENNSIIVDRGLEAVPRALDAANRGLDEVQRVLDAADRGLDAIQRALDAVKAERDAADNEQE
jgi:hypothetical protein